MANNVIKRIWNQNKMVDIEALQGMAFQAEDGGHTFEISGIDDQGNPVELSGTVAGVFRRPDNADIALTGDVLNGKVYVTLTDSCYAISGRFGLTIFVTSGGKKVAVYAAIGTVSQTSGGAVAGDTPQDVVDLINAIAAAVATIPPEYTDLTNSVKKLYDGIETISFDVVENSYPDRNTGEFVTYNNWNRTGYIPVNGGEQIYVNNIYPTNDNCFYDSGKNYISGFSIPVGSPAVISVPDNAAYMVCSNSAVDNRFFTAFYREAGFVTEFNTELYAETNGVRQETLLTVERPVTRQVTGVTFTSGYMDVNGQVTSSSSYFYTSKIQVDEGDVIYPIILPSNVRPIRFVCAYDGDTPVPAKGSSTQLDNGFTVPAGISHVVLTCYTPSTGISFMRQTEEGVTSLRNNKSKRAISTEAASLAENEDLKIPEGEFFYNKKNCSYAFWGEFSTFNKVVLGHGTSYYGTTYIEIDGTNVTVREGLENSKVGEYAHGLTFSDFIAVSIKVDNGYLPKATVTIGTNGGQFIQTDVPFVGCYGDIFAHGTAALTNARLSYSMFDLDTDMMIFGDSYTSLQDVNRWPYHVMSKGFSEFLLCGFSGATSAQILEAFKQMIYFRQPKYIAWFLGMNDADSSSAYNASWKSCIDYVISTAESIGAEVILATIPNTPTVDNTKKNAWVKSSGYRYVDFANAVGAESANSSWYSGMLSSDNVHPTQYGARALASKLLVDMPEIK